MQAINTQVPWQQFKLQLRKTWNKLTDADLETISAGSVDLVDVVECRYAREGAASSKPQERDPHQALTDTCRIGQIRRMTPVCK